MYFLNQEQQRERIINRMRCTDYRKRVGSSFSVAYLLDYQIMLLRRNIILLQLDLKRYVTFERPKCGTWGFNPSYFRILINKMMYFRINPTTVEIVFFCPIDFTA